MLRMPIGRLLLLSLLVMGLAGPHAPAHPDITRDNSGRIRDLFPPAAEVSFMREFIREVNPVLHIEDAHCAEQLPAAIFRHAQATGEDWTRIFTLAWQESAFDCHAKNRFDRGGAYGPFQIRPLWKPVVGDPRHRYYDPELSVQRVTQVMRYFQQTPRYQRLLDQGLSTPLLCLYNSGEVQRINSRYCRQVGAKLEAVRDAWEQYQRLLPAYPSFPPYEPPEEVTAWMLAETSP